MTSATEFADHPTLDVFVYRRLADGRYAHIGGSGRGEGWAGIVEIHLDAEPLLRTAVGGPEVASVHAQHARRIVGPYWARDAAVVPLTNDEFVVIGGPDAVTNDHGRCRAIAQTVSDSIAEVSPAKRLADELELLHAVSDVAMTPLDEVRVVADRLVGLAARALSCEIGILHLPGAGVTAVAAQRARIAPTHAEAAAWAEMLLGDLGDRQECFQDVRDPQRPAATAWADDVLSLIAVPIDLDARGVLLLAHTVQSPRGFTQLCQQIAGSVADAARTVLLACTTHERLREQAETATERSRTDGLTGLLNRLGWDEAIASADDGPRPVSVLVADVNYLKRVNDAQGHSAGDALLRSAARALRAAVRADDPVARVGGDEFCVLLAGVGEDRAAATVADVQREAARSEPPVSLAIGAVTANEREALDAVVCRADRLMYEDKARNRG